MSTQLVVRIPDELAKALEVRAKRMARKRSEVVRMAIRQYMEVGSLEDQGRVSEKMEKYFGVLKSGIPDLGTEHRKYLKEFLRRGR